MPTLFDALKAGELSLANRLAMAPMARRRATPAGLPSEHAAMYYSQRASAGLVITEGTAPCAMGKGSGGMPGIYNDEQVAGWRKVTDAVHRAGGKIVVQLMHSGRMAHSSRLPGGAMPVAPSAVKPKGQVATAGGMVDYETPRALELAEIAGVVREYAHATRCALEAGFDGVELHGASGFLPMEFLCSSTNQRGDAYGGSAQNRARFLLEVLAAMAGVAGPGRVGVKLSPENPHNDIADANPVETFTTAVEGIAALKLAYLHIAALPAWSRDYHALLKPLFHRHAHGGAYLAGGGLTRETAAAMVETGRADGAVFGVLFLCNPDLPERFRQKAALNAPDRDTFYTPGPKGYIDYPLLASP